MRNLSNLYSMEVLVNGKPVNEYPHTDGHTYIEGREGSEYSIRLINNSYQRVKAVLAVDGLSVLTGDHDWTNGIILEASTPTYRSQVVIEGWRVNNATSAKFIFADIKKSYSNRSGNGISNVGVIGVMFFQEQIPVTFGTPITTFSSTVNQPSVLRSSSIGYNSVVGQAVNSVGTGWGEAIESSYKETAFVPRDPNNPDALLSLYYDSAKGLDKRGVVRYDSSKYNPNPFPGTYYASTLRGCKPPQN